MIVYNASLEDAKFVCKKLELRSSNFLSKMLVQNDYPTNKTWLSTTSDKPDNPGAGQANF